MSEEAADQRIQAQWPLSRKCELADAVINNSSVHAQNWLAQTVHVAAEDLRCAHTRPA